MHLFCMTRGEQSAVRNCMNDISAQFFQGVFNKELAKVVPKVTDAKTGKVVKTEAGTPKLMQCIVQPIQLWSIVFPEEELSIMQQTLYTGDFSRYHGKAGKPYTKDQLAVFALRKMLRAKKCPPIPEGTKVRPIRKDGVEILPIGIKEDSHSSGFEGL